jgi:indolepyruvate ferredoxin oxidoreductase beta subunit
VGRAIELGFPSPARTTIIASTHRLYSIHEKIATGGGLYPVEDLHRAARAMSRRLIAFDALAVAREHGTEVNAVLLGALAASGVVPLGANAFRAAIEAKGVAVKANLAGFDIGYQLARAADGAAPAAGPPVTRDPGAADRPPALEAFSEELAGFPPALHDVLRQAVPRLLDYQDRTYVARYLERLRPFAVPGADLELAGLVARHLAVWMTYEDAIRVADLKTRAARFERIRAAARAPGAIVTVTDYLKPDLDEIYGILPYRLVAPFARWAEKRWPHGRPTLGQHVTTTTIIGFLRVWLLARLKRLRPSSYRARLEHARMERWLADVAHAVAWDRELALELARAADLVKGYGDVRRRMTGLFDHLLERVLGVAALEAGSGDFGVSRQLARRYRALVREGPDSEVKAPALADQVLARMRAGDRPGALALLDTAVAPGAVRK